MRTSLVLDALAMPVGTRQPGAAFQLVLHSHRGSPYTSGFYTQTGTCRLRSAPLIAHVGGRVGRSDLIGT
jgi:hypothetical protein